MSAIAPVSAPPATAPVTVFERMSHLARSLGAINLGQGFPDMPPPAELIDSARRALVEQSNQYPPMRGLPELRSAIVQYYDRVQQVTVDLGGVVVTSGATEALAAAFLALVRPGDEVILVQPLYDSYLPLVERAGGRAVLIDLAPPRWTLDLDRLAAAITPTTRLLVLNTPNNPTGTVLDRATLDGVGALCQRHDIVLLCDEVWEATLFDRPHVSALDIPSLADRTVKIGSAGKIFALTGWKVGWAVAAPPLADAIAAQHQYLTFTTPPPLQWAVAEGLGLPAEWHADHLDRYARARRRFVAGLEAGGYCVLPADGTWFASVDLAASGLPGDDVDIAEAMIRQAGVAAIPVSAFYAVRAETGYLRLCFAKQDDTLDAAIERLCAFRKVRA